MKILFFFYFYILGATVYGNGATYKKLGKVPGSILVFDKEYSDLRLDHDLDGKIDFWSIKKGSLQIDIYYTNEMIKKKFVRRFFPTYVLEYFYKIEKNQLTLQWAKKRSLLAMNISRSNGQICGTNVADIEKQIKTLSQVVNEDVLFTAVDNLIDPNCRNILPKESFKQLERNLFQSLSAEKNPLLECFSNSKFINSFSKSEDGQLEAKILSSRFELLRLQLSVNSENHKPTLSCASPSTNKKGVLAQTLENGKVILFTPLETEKLNDILNHEFLHLTEVASEIDVDKILKLCTEIEKPSYVIENDKSKITPVLSGNVAAASVAQSNEKTANISPNSTDSLATKLSENSTANDGVLTITSQDLTAAIPPEMTVAQSGVPSVASLSQGLNNPYPMNNEGAEAALSASKALSAPLITKANTLLGAMNSKAVASSTILASKRNTLNIKNLEAGERIVEKFTLDDDNTPINSGTTANLMGKTPQTETSKGDSTIVQNLPSRSASPLNNSSDSFVAVSNNVSRSPASIGDQTIKPSSTNPNGERSARTPQRTNAPSTSQEEVITFISRADYSTAKNKLQDSSFTQQLASQGITILDLNGNAYGAKKGSVIFLDEGHRFVRQK